jgi:phage-related minor tail protein
LEERLEEVVALMRAEYLQRLQLDLGRTEAQALAIRLAAPAATAGWQLYSNLQGILGKVGGTIGSILSAIARLFT